MVVRCCLYVVSCYLLGAKIGFNLPYTVSYIAAAVLCLAYGAAVTLYGRKTKQALPE